MVIFTNWFAGWRYGDFQLKVMVIFTDSQVGDMFQASYAIMLYEDVDF